MDIYVKRKCYFVIISNVTANGILSVSKQDQKLKSKKSAKIFFLKISSMYVIVRDLSCCVAEAENNFRFEVFV